MKTTLFILILLSSPFSFSKSKKLKEKEFWHTTHALEKFPCMNQKEEEFFKKTISIAKTEDKFAIHSEHQKQFFTSSRSPASIKPQSPINTKFICPPFHGVRNPHPQALEFGKASPFEEIKIQSNKVEVLNGLNKNEKWQTNFDMKKGFIEGTNPRGTPIHLIPIAPENNKPVRFLVHYLIWQDKTPPMMTFCYREDLHNQCNPYKETAVKPIPPPTVH